MIVSDFHTELIQQLTNAGIQKFVYQVDTVAQSFETIDTFGKLFDRQPEAREIIETNQQQLDLIERKLARAVPGEKKRVIRLMGRNRVMIPGNDSFQNELIRLAGGIPPDLGKPGSMVEVTRDEWIAFNPQVIYGCGGDKQAAEAFFSREGWNQVDAVKNHRIFYFPCELTCRAATRTGYFVQWLSSMIYTQAFSLENNWVIPRKQTISKPVCVPVDYVTAARVVSAMLYDFQNKTLLVEFDRPQTILSTLEGWRTGISTVGNHYSPPPTWGPGHLRGIDHIRQEIFLVHDKHPDTTSILMTGADMDNLSIHTKQYQDLAVTALVTAGVMSNAMRMSRDTGRFYEPGTINIILLTNTALSHRAMTRAVISATEAKTAALQDLDIRSTYTPQIHEATGTGTDNVLVVKGEGIPIDNAGGHSKMGELIARAVYAGVTDAVHKQNGVTASRHIFQRLKERQISVFSLVSRAECDCMHQAGIPGSKLAQTVEHLLLEPEYSAFMASALAVSDAYEKGLITDLTLYRAGCLATARAISGRPVDRIPDYLPDHDMPLVLKTAVNTLIAGAVDRLNPSKE